MFGMKIPALPKPPSRNYETLDAIAVVGSLVIVAGIVAGLFMFKLDPAVAPIVASLATAILGIPVSYGAFRWGNSVGNKAAADAAADAAAKASEKSTDALVRIAGGTLPTGDRPPTPVVIEPPADQSVPTTDIVPTDDDDPTPPDESALARPLVGAD